MRIIQLCLMAFFLVPVALDTRAQNQLPSYDVKTTFDYQEKLIGEKDGIKIFDGSYAGVDGGRIGCYLVLPAGKGTFAGIVFQHGSEQNRYTYVATAVLLAKAGAISLITDVEFPETDSVKLDQFRSDYIRTIFNMRRAVDLLVSREDVDKTRIGFVGHSHGAIVGSIFASVDKRITTFVLLGGLARLTEHMRNSPGWESLRTAVPKDKFEDFLTKIKPLDPVEFIGRSSPANILFQCANHDEVVPKESCQSLYQAAGEPKQIKWYDTQHDFQDFDAAIDQVKWLQQNLRLKPLGPIIQKKLAEK